MENCNKCKLLTGMYFERKYKPVEYILGNTNSKIWIIGINPKGDIGYNNKDENITDMFNSDFNNSYFKDFKNVSNKLYNMLINDRTVAHTDLIKCFSNSFPPVKLRKKELHEIILNCRTNLDSQLKKYKPKLIICNGGHVNYHIKELITPINEKEETYYTGKIEKENVTVVLSGFIGRIDNISKRRLGKEIDKIIKEL